MHVRGCALLNKFLYTAIYTWLAKGINVRGAAIDVVSLSSQVGANAGVVGMAKEHLGLALALNVPVFVVVTKIDMCPVNVLQDTLKMLQRILKSPGCRKIPVLVQSMDDVVVAATNFTSERWVPDLSREDIVWSSVIGSLFLHLTPTFVCEFDVRRHPPSCITVVHFFPQQFLLFYDIVPHSVQSCSLRPISLLSPMYFHFHRPPSYVVLLSSHHMLIPIQPPFLDFLLCKRQLLSQKPAQKKHFLATVKCLLFIFVLAGIPGFARDSCIFSRQIWYFPQCWPP